MNYIDFRRHFDQYTVFTLADIRNFEPNFDQRRLSEWQDKGYLQIISRGNYRFPEKPLADHDLWIIANKIYSPSYVSLEMGLSHYGLIPEGVYTVTSVSSNKTMTFSTPVATFSYQSIRPELMFGIKLLPLNNTRALVGEIEKVLLDYLYLHPELNNEVKIEGLRLNGEVLKTGVSWELVEKYLEVFNKKTLSNRVMLVKDIFL